MEDDGPCSVHREDSPKCIQTFTLNEEYEHAFVGRAITCVPSSTEFPGSGSMMEVFSQVACAAGGWFDLILCKPEAITITAAELQW